MISDILHYETKSWQSISSRRKSLTVSKPRPGGHGPKTSRSATEQADEENWQWLIIY
jgi:hypothetical protein